MKQEKTGRERVKGKGEEAEEEEGEEEEKTTRTLNGSLEFIIF